MAIVKPIRQPKLEFPSLFSGDQLDTEYLAHQKQQTNGSQQQRAEDYHPLPVIEVRFPRIAEIIHATWGTPELDNYFNKLLIDERGDRAGFPADVVKALLALSHQHIEQFGFRSLSDAWTSDPHSHK